MGMPWDMQQRITLARVDDVSRRSRVEAARESIYKNNNKVNSAGVEKLLGNDSLVPTAVRLISAPACHYLRSYCFESECVFHQTWAVRFLFVPHACCGSYA